MANHTIPKSLHTVRVLVELGRLLMANHRDLTAFEATNKAAALLGYANTPDDYDLIAKAVSQLTKAK